MARPRSQEREDWPPYLYQDGCNYSYKNPISGVRYGLGADMSQAIAIVTEANRILTVSDIRKLPRGSRRLAYSDAARKARLNQIEAPAAVRRVIPEVFRDRPILAAQRRIDAWAALLDGKREQVRLPVRIRGLRRGSTPAWLTKLWTRAKQRAAKKGITFSLSPDDLVDLAIKSGGICAVSGIRLRHDTVESGKRPWAPSLDRIDCRLGYTRKNTRIVCVAANLAMNQWGEQVLLEMAMAIAQKQLKATKGA